MSYNIQFSDTSLAQLETIGKSSTKIFRQVMMKAFGLRRSPKPQDCKKLENFSYQEMDGYRVDQGEYRIIYAVNEKEKRVYIALVRHTSEVYKTLS
ncbi:MAG: cytotoxic translational repressor of toxin-antitoxin stability system [Syntrophus sp. (in: bacteria)]|nr:cytotoxic translational repressor of toxin-antitoxin stability system [Syntrophus sp. (in: bacteria)]